GNSRAMTLARVYDRGGEEAANYKTQLKQKAQQFGIRPEEIDRFEKPVLVRELTGEHEPTKAIADFNKGAPAELKPEERAVADGKRLSRGTVQEIASRLGDQGEGATMAEALRGDNGPEVLQRLVKDGVLTAQEAPGYVNAQNQLTPEAKS